MQIYEIIFAAVDNFKVLIMRRKIVEPIDAGAELPQLTEKQSEFVRGILSGKTASDAYRAAYDAGGMQPCTIWARASELRNDSTVAAWLAAARKAGLGHAVVTLDAHITELERLKEIAIETGNVGAAVQAEQLRGKASGHYKESVDITMVDPFAELHALAAISPEFAELLAQDKGIEWDRTKH